MKLASLVDSFARTHAHPNEGIALLQLNACQCVCGGGGVGEATYEIRNTHNIVVRVLLN